MGMGKEANDVTAGGGGLLHIQNAAIGECDHDGMKKGVATRKGSVLGVRLYLGRQATHVMMDRHKKTRNQEVKKNDYHGG
jgi:hypothetical protein